VAKKGKEGMQKCRRKVAKNGGEKEEGKPTGKKGKNS